MALKNIDDAELTWRAHEAYKSLLAIPLGSIDRFRADQAMALLRDILADMAGRDAESIQTAYEAEAYQVSTPRSG